MFQLGSVRVDEIETIKEENEEDGSSSSESSVSEGSKDAASIDENVNGSPFEQPKPLKTMIVISDEGFGSSEKYGSGSQTEQMIPYSFVKDVIKNEDKLIDRLKTRRNNMLKTLSEGKLPLTPL